jgi:hypothetical protein
VRLPSGEWALLGSLFVLALYASPGILRSRLPGCPATVTKVVGLLFTSLAIAPTAKRAALMA